LKAWSHKVTTVTTVTDEREPETRSRLTTGALVQAIRHSDRWQVGALLGIVLLCATVIRVAGTRFGFPLLLHPDEWAVVDGVVDMARRNSFEPPWSLRPDHVEMKLDYFVFAAYATLKGHSIEAAFASDPLAFYWVARMVTAAFGVATVGLAFLVGARWSRSVGLLAAALFALFPPFVANAFFATPDVPLTFALMLMVYALMRYTSSRSWASLLWASFAVAVAVGIKYPGGVGTCMIAIVVIVAAVRDRAWLRMLVHGAGSAGAFIGFLFVISPTLFTDFSGVRRELEVQAAGGRLGHPDLGLLGNLRFYVTTYIDASGVVLTLLALVGAAVAVSNRRLEVLPWLSGLLVWVSLSTLPMTWDRWGLPMWITPLLFGAAGLGAVLETFRSSRTRWVAAALTAVVIANFAAGAARELAARIAPDTRQAAVAGARAEGVTRENSSYEGYTPFLPGEPAFFFKEVEPRRGGYVLFTKKRVPATYAIVSSGMYQRVFSDPVYHKEARIYRWIFRNGTLVQQFEPSAMSARSKLEPVSILRNLRLVQSVASGAMTGPVIRIYRMPSRPAPGA
jgi:hypothetical protein